MLAFRAPNPASINNLRKTMGYQQQKGTIDTMCTLEEHFVQKGIVKVAKNMLAQGISLKTVKTCTGLTLQKLQELTKSLAPHPPSKPVRATA